MNFSKYSSSLFLSAILVFGSLLRFIMLDRFPNGLFRDESALGYNAYSIWQTGRDEYGTRFPVVFRSFEVFFLPAYVYLSTPIVGIFGLSVFNVRFLSALSGVVALVSVWFIADELWKNDKISLIAVFLLAVSPWHIFYSRGAFEGNLALTLFSLGFLFWLKFVKGLHGKFLCLSCLFFVFSMYSYQAERLVVPLFGLVAGLVSWRSIRERKGRLFLAVLPSMLILIPLLLISFNAGGNYRAMNVSFFLKKEGPPGWKPGVPSGLLSNNSIYLRVRQLTSIYLSYFSPRNLFVEGDSDRQRSVENFSVLYSWMFPFLVVGVIFVVRKVGVSGKLLLAWILLGPLPASATSDPFHTYRALLTFLPMTMVIGYGLWISFGMVGQRWKVFVPVILVVGLFSFMQFLFSYFVTNSFTRAREWDYGYEDLVGFVNSLPKAKRVVVDDPKTTPYIHFLFFGKVNPLAYQQETENKQVFDRYYTSSEELRPSRLGKFEFRTVDWPLERGDSGMVFVMANFLLPPSEFVTDPNVKLLREINYPDGKTAFRIVKIR